MSINSKYLKDTGLIAAYQNFLKQVMNNRPDKEDALLEASKFFLNYEKKHKNLKEVEIPESFGEVKLSEKKERKRIVLETKARVYPSAPVITPQVFEKHERSRPLIGSYKKEEIQYEYRDILDGELIQPEVEKNDNE